MAEDGGFVFLVEQSIQLDCKGGQHNSPCVDEYRYFKIAKSHGDVKDRNQKIDNLKKGNPYILAMNNDCCVRVEKDLKTTKKEIKKKVRDLGGVQQAPHLKRGWFCYGPGTSPMSAIVQIFCSYHNQ